MANGVEDIYLSPLPTLVNYTPAYTWNRPQTMTFPGGTQRTYGYDALMRLQALTVLDPNSTPLLNYQYSYDEVGNILTKNTEHGNYSYGYDAVSRLTSADNPVLDDEAYTYDNVGNRLTSADVSGSWNYNLNNELLGYADVEYEYDANGNLTQITVAGSVVWTYTYDAANRLVHVEDGTGTISADYYYDPFGRRLWKDVGGTKTYFFYSEEGLIAEYDASGTELRSYGYRPDSTWTTDPLWLKEGGTYYWYQNDHLGTPQKLVAQDGTVVWSAQYTAFGEADVQVETVVNNLRFPGQYADAETELLYNCQRYYDPKIGRYLRTDPMGLDSGDVNLYEYTGDNPTSRSDALGLFWWISRKEKAKASAVCCNDTVEGLARKIGLDPYQYTEWLTPVAGDRYPVSPTQVIPYQKFFIPNTVYAYWAGNFGWLGRANVNWNDSISYLQKLGFKVIEKRHDPGSGHRIELDLDPLFDKKELHGLYFWGHGGRDGLSYGVKWIGPIFVGFAVENETVLEYASMRYRTYSLYYSMGLGLIFGCYTNQGKGKPSLIGVPPEREGVIWAGIDGIVFLNGKIVGRKNPPSPGESVEDLFHVRHWIRPGDQETRFF